MNLCRSRVVNYTFRPWLLEYFMSFKLSRTIITLLIPCCKFFVPYLWWKSLVSPHDGVLGYWARYSPFRIEALRNRVFALLTILRHRDCSWGLTKKQVISKNNLPVSLSCLYLLQIIIFHFIPGLILRQKKLSPPLLTLIGASKSLAILKSTLNGF